MKHLFLLLSLLSAFKLFSQIDYPDIPCSYGPRQIGYRQLELIDSTRDYSRIMDYDGKSYRPVSVSIWEPAKSVACSEPLRIKDYLKVLQQEEEWPDLPFSYFFDWFYIPGTPHNVAQADHQTQAIRCYEATESKSPIILYAASYRASSTENFMLGEYLASHGYRVLALPSKGHDHIQFEGGTLKDATAQYDDINFVISQTGKLLQDVESDIILMGFSFGGIAHILNGMNHPRVKGIVSLDGTIKYRPETIEASPDYDLGAFEIPFIHFSQKDVPVAILQEQGIDTAINHSFSFYDSISVPLSYQLKSVHLSHSYFATYGLLFHERDPRQDPEYRLIARAYQHLLQQTQQAIALISEPDYSPSRFEAALRQTAEFRIVDKKIQSPFRLTFTDFIEFANFQSYDILIAQYDSVQRVHPDFVLEEGYLNTLGLQWIFSEATYEAGVHAFKLALSLYPQSANLHDSLAEGYRHQGDREQAITHFKKSLELDASNTNAQGRLKELE